VTAFEFEDLIPKPYPAWSQTFSKKVWSKIAWRRDQTAQRKPFVERFDRKPLAAWRGQAAQRLRVNACTQEGWFMGKWNYFQLL